jgi:hypothetical protein
MIAKRWLATGCGLALVLALAAPAKAQRDPWTWVTRYHFDIDPKTPLKELLPTPPANAPIRKLLVSDLAHVTEVQFAEPMVVEQSKQEEQLVKNRQASLIQIALQLAKINFLNAGKADDRFMTQLIDNRTDLRAGPGRPRRTPLLSDLQFRRQETGSVEP